jgi:radical SAM protein (TIGR01212 family)
MEKRYNDLNTYLRRLYGCRVQKITIDAGLSCPNRDGTLSADGCIFCNPKGSGTGAHEKGLSITEQIAMGKKRLSKRYQAKKFLAYFQSFTNTYAPFDHLRTLYEEALFDKDVVGLCIGTRPDCVSERVLSLLESYTKTHLIWIEYGLQTACDQTLSFINRGHDFHSFKRAVDATKGRGIKIGVHVILGLPGENRSHMLHTAQTIASMEIDGIKIHLQYVIKGTRLEKLFRSGEYDCLGQNAYVHLVCEFLERIPSGMVIHRLTGDPHPEELVAPDWALDKARTLKQIQNTLKQRNSWQGKKLDAMSD